MIVKGIVSSVSGQTAEVILPEFGNEVTAPLPILQHDNYVEIAGAEYPVKGRYTVGQLVAVAVFSDDFNDGVIL